MILWKKKTSLVVNNIGAQRPQTSVKATIFFQITESYRLKMKMVKERHELILKPMNLANFYRRNNSARIQWRNWEDPSHILPEAILAMEDSRFYEHEGVDFIGLTRAVIVD